MYKFFKFIFKKNITMSENVTFLGLRSVPVNIKLCENNYF